MAENTKYRERLEEYKRRTAKQPTHEITMDEIVLILRAGEDPEGNKVIDRYCNGPVCNCVVELPDGQWRCYSVK